MLQRACTALRNLPRLLLRDHLFLPARRFAVALCPTVRPSVRHKPILYIHQNGYKHRIKKKQRRTIAQGSRQNSDGITAKRGATCEWDR